MRFDHLVSAIQNEKGMCARCDGFSDLGEMRAHGLCVGMRHDQSGRFSPFRADGAENVAPDAAETLETGGSDHCPTDALRWRHGHPRAVRMNRPDTPSAL